MPETAPGAAAQPQPQQAPFGSSPATGPTPNRGYEAAAMQRLGLVAKQLQEIEQLVGITSEIGRKVHDMLGSILKIIPAGATSPAAEKNNIENMAMRNAQQGAASRQMAEQRAQQMKGGGQGAQMAAAA